MANSIQVKIRLNGYALLSSFPRKRESRPARPQRFPWIPAFRGDDGSQDMRMQKHIGCWWIVGLFGLLAAANAQTASPPAANTRFDGTYAFVSATKVNETFVNYHGRTGQCWGWMMGPLTILNGRARYSGSSGRQSTFQFEGTIRSPGELAMRNLSEPGSRGAGAAPGFEINVSGRIGGNGTVRARQSSNRCNRDLIWQKASR
jgi:hypothetical protein